MNKSYMTDTSENAFEKGIVDWLVTKNGFELGNNTGFNVEYAVDEERLFRFLRKTQEQKLEQLHILENELAKKKFMDRLSKELSSAGIVDLLRKGIKHEHLTLDLYYMLPAPQNETAKKLYAENIFSVTRQVHYSKVESKKSVDLVVFINGLPVLTSELKNLLTHQNTACAVEQYQGSRSPSEPLFHFKRCMVHFAVDDQTIQMCTRLKGKDSWFLPFNKGHKDGAGNPPNPAGLKTDYFWKEILAKPELSLIIEKFAQVTEEKDRATGKPSHKQIFPRYHQLSAVKTLLADVTDRGVGRKYLIQHSAGSGKSNTIAWLAHQLVGQEKDEKKIFDSVIVVTDRVNLDKQIKNTIRQFAQVNNLVGHATSAAELREMLATGKKIIVTIVHKFPFILDGIETANKDRNFALLIDEAHSSQNGSMSAKMGLVLSGTDVDEEEDIEDKVNAIIEGRKLLKNASYFAFTATPKNKTLEMFGVPCKKDDGTTGFTPFHKYTMKQAIEEGFILDVVKYYMSVDTYYKLEKTVKDDPAFDSKKALKRLRAYVEGHESSIEKKAGIIVDHFLANVIGKRKINGKAKAMVVTNSIVRAITFYTKIVDELKEKNSSQYKVLLAFSGEKEWHGKKCTEATFNGFPSSKIEETFAQDEYRILVVANKFQTGFDEPLLHTMYVDKELSDIKAVQTLSRLNRAYPGKIDTFVLDFANKAEEIKAAFDKYYKTTSLSGETDRNKLNDLITGMEKHQVYSPDDVQRIVELSLSKAPREKLDFTLDACVESYKALTTDQQVDFKSRAKNFVRTYNFLATILAFGNREWEKLSIFLNYLIGKLPPPKDDDLSKEVLESVDFDSFKAIQQSIQAIQLADEDATIDPVPIGGGGGKAIPDMEPLSYILENFHKAFGNVKWTDADKVRKQIEALPEEVMQSESYRNAALNASKDVARSESEKATRTAILSTMASGLDLYRIFQENDAFQRTILDAIFEQTYAKLRKPQSVEGGIARVS